MLEDILKRDRVIVVSGLVLVAVLAWVYTLAGAGMGMSAFQMSSLPWSGNAMDDGEMAMHMEGETHFIILLLMWWVMMIAMMLPSASPTILLAAAINRRTSSPTPPYGSTAWFTAGYLVIWLVFSIVATVLHVMMEETGQLSAMMQLNNHMLSGALLIAAGLWQFSPIKQACLKHCRSPVYYLTEKRRPGNYGAFMMGLGHGTFCLGCCWFLMALLFVGGIMNVFWIAGLALFVLAEKLLARGIWYGRITGIILTLSGLGLLLV